MILARAGYLCHKLANFEEVKQSFSKNKIMNQSFVIVSVYSNDVDLKHGFVLPLLLQNSAT